MNIDSFLFGFTAGAIMNMATRAATYEPISARPFSYLSTGIAFGVAIWYYDYWRRRAIEEVLYSEERRRYNVQLKALNRSRIGEEHEISNLIEYLTNTTVKE